MLAPPLPTPPARWFRLAYLVPERDGRELPPSQGRDADATLAVHEALLARGYRYAGPIYNYPGKERRPHIDDEIDESFFRADDLLVLTTRPPLSDDQDLPRKRIARSFTRLEERVLACLRRHLPHCSRTRVVVSDSHQRVSRDIARLSNVLFFQNGGAAIEDAPCDDRAPDERDWPDTLAYLIFEQHAWRDGPALLAAFGMTGTVTLGWNFLLARAHADLIGKVAFALVEVRAPAQPRRPQTLAFLRDWSVRIHTSDARVALHDHGEHP